MFKSFKNEEGFTLIELLVVIVIILALSAVAVPIYLNQAAKAASAADTATVTNIAQAISTDLATSSVLPTITAASASTTGSLVTASSTIPLPAGTVLSVPTLSTATVAGTFCVSKGGYRSDNTSGGTIASTVVCGGATVVVDTVLNGSGSVFQVSGSNTTTYSVLSIRGVSAIIIGDTLTVSNSGVANVDGLYVITAIVQSSNGATVSGSVSPTTNLDLTLSGPLAMSSNGFASTSWTLVLHH
jgi:type IV pilus assembly protein PilA